MKREGYIFWVLLVVIQVSTLFSAGQVQVNPDLPYIGLLPPGFDKELEKCWSSVHSTEGCVNQIYKVHGNITQIGLLSPKCCKTIIHLSTSCSGKMFHNPLFIPYLKSYCLYRDEPTSSTPQIGTNPPSPSPKIAIDSYKVTDLKAPQNFAPWLGLDYAKCLSSLQSVEGCIEEVFGSLTSFQFRLPGQACCKAVTEISESCWSKLLPLNPFMNPLLKGYCDNIVKVAPAPTKQV